MKLLLHMHEIGETPRTDYFSDQFHNDERQLIIELSELEYQWNKAKSQSRRIKQTFLEIQLDEASKQSKGASKATTLNEKVRQMGPFIDANAIISRTCRETKGGAFISKDSVRNYQPQEQTKTAAFKATDEFSQKVVTSNRSSPIRSTI